MKFERNDKYNTIAVYALIVIISSGIIIALMFNLGAIWNMIMSLIGILKPLIYGFIMAFALLNFNSPSVLGITIYIAVLKSLYGIFTICIVSSSK